MKERELIAKIKKDLSGALDHWQGRMTHWTFVHNDIAGLTAHTVQVLEDVTTQAPS